MRPGLFEEWQAYASLEPFGHPSEDEHLAYLVAAIYNAQGGKRVSEGHYRAYRLDEFLLRHGLDAQRRAQQAERRLTPEETRKHVAELFAPYGGYDPRYSQSLSPEQQARLAQMPRGFV